MNLRDFQTGAAVLNPGDIHQARIRRRVNEQVEIAVLSVIAIDHCTKHASVTRMVRFHDAFFISIQSETGSKPRTSKAETVFSNTFLAQDRKVVLLSVDAKALRRIMNLLKIVKVRCAEDSMIPVNTQALT